MSVVATRTVERQGDPRHRCRRSISARKATGVLVCGDARLLRLSCGLAARRPSRRRAIARRCGSISRCACRSDATLDVCTVNGGTLKVEGTEGRYTLRNVNGDLEMVQVRGAGRASTVNGDLEASFAAPPDAAAEFRTVNGRVERHAAGRAVGRPPAEDDERWALHRLRNDAAASRRRPPSARSGTLRLSLATDTRRSAWATAGRN